VCLGHDNDDRFPTVKRGFNKASIPIYYRTVIRVERNLMGMRNRRALSSVSSLGFRKIRVNLSPSRNRSLIRKINSPIPPC
jgi:hypothetical protein